MEIKKEKYIFLYLKTGGGHLAPARSLSEYLQKNYPDKISARLEDGFEKTPGIIRYIIEDGYRKLQAGAKWYYEFLYALNKITWMAKITALIVSFFCEKHIKDVILNYKPDKIVILHFFLIRPVYKVVKKYKLPVKVFTVVTDPYTAHPLWFLEKHQHYIVFSERLKEFLSRREPDADIKVMPFILGEKFTKELPPEQIPGVKEKLSVPTGKKVVLILGGGDGIPHGKKILSAILQAKLDAVIILVAGRDKQLYNTALALKEIYKPQDFRIYGFIDFVYDILNISDIVVTKCGASTMMEILMVKKVPVVNAFIWEQEKGNIEFLINNNFGIYEPEISKVPLVLKKLIEDEEYYCFFRKNIIAANLKNGTAETAEIILNS